MAPGFSVISPWPRPEAGDGAHERALAGAGFAGHQDLLAKLDGDIRIVHHDGAVAQRDRDILQPDRRAFILAAADRAGLVFDVVERIDCDQKI